MNKALAILLLVLAIPNLAAVASEEEFLEWRTVAIRCMSTPESGDVSCEITTGEKGWESFSIRAFGMDHSVPQADLKKLNKFPLSSVSTRHEAGCEKLGGYTVHFRFKRTFYDSEKKLITETIYVSVTKNGVKVSEPRTLQH